MCLAAWGPDTPARGSCVAALSHPLRAWGRMRRCCELRRAGPQGKAPPLWLAGWQQPMARMRCRGRRPGLWRGCEVGVEGVHRLVICLATHHILLCFSVKNHAYKNVYFPVFKIISVGEVASCALFLIYLLYSLIICFAKNWLCCINCSYGKHG